MGMETEGGEGGGHTGPVATTLLLPSVLDAVDIPVVAGGAGTTDVAGRVAGLLAGGAHRVALTNPTAALATAGTTTGTGANGTDAGPRTNGTDPTGQDLAVTAPAVADEIAGAVELAQGKLGGRPFGVVRGRTDLVLDLGDDGPGAAALVRPEGGPGAWRFREIDVARVRLIVELRQEMWVEERTLPLVLSLLDQLYDARRAMRRLGAAMAGADEATQARLHDLLRRG